MKRLTRFAPLAVALLAGCASFSSLQPATPPDYAGPTANVADQVVQVSGQLLHVFEIAQVDDRRLLSSSIATVQANQGRGFAVAPVALTNELPLQPTRVRLQAATQYAAPLLAMSNPTCRTLGDVTFTPQEGKRYAVRGRITAQACEAWIEDLASGQPVTDKVSGPGTGR